MISANNNLITEVFDEMVKHKPVLSKHLIIDEDEDEVDSRILADQIIQNFPWPIGIELRRLPPLLVLSPTGHKTRTIRLNL